MRRRRSVKTFTWELSQERWCGGDGGWGVEVRWTCLFLSFTNSFKYKKSSSFSIFNEWAKSICINVTSNDPSESICAPQLVFVRHICILTPWFSHPVSLWHWDHRRAAWQRWLSAWCRPSAGQTFPVLCGEGIRTSVAIPARGEEGERFGPSCHGYFKTCFRLFGFIRKLREETKHGNGKGDDTLKRTSGWTGRLCICILKVCSDNTQVNHLQCTFLFPSSS